MNKGFIAGFVGLLLFSAAQTVTVKNRCAPVWIDSNKIAFDLNGVRSGSIDQPDTFNSSALSIELSLCKPITPDQIDPSWNCPNKPQDNMVYVYDPVSLECKPMTNPSSILETTLIKNSDNVTGITLTYTNKDTAPDFSYKNKNLQINIICDKSIDNSKIQWTVNDTDSNYLIFTTSAKAGCGYSLKDLINMFESYKLVAAGIMFFLGLMFTFFGKRFFSITITLTGFLIGFLSIAGTAYLFSAMNTADAKRIGAVLFVAFLFGVLIGWLFHKFKVITTMGAVGLLFFFIGNAVERLYLARWINQTWSSILILVVFVLLGVAYGFFYSKQCIMFSTAFGGSFLVVLALSIATNTYSSPAQIAAMIKNGDKVIYPYLWGGLWALLGIVGFVIQIIRSKKHPEDDGQEVMGTESFSDYNKMYK